MNPITLGAFRSDFQVTGLNNKTTLKSMPQPSATEVCKPRNHCLLPVPTTRLCIVLWTQEMQELAGSCLILDQEASKAYSPLSEPLKKSRAVVMRASSPVCLHSCSSFLAFWCPAAGQTGPLVPASPRVVSAEGGGWISNQAKHIANQSSLLHVQASANTSLCWFHYNHSALWHWFLVLRELKAKV